MNEASKDPLIELAQSMHPGLEGDKDSGEDLVSDSVTAESLSASVVEALQAAKAEFDYQRAGHIELRRIDRERLDYLARLVEAAIRKATGAQ